MLHGYKYSNIFTDIVFEIFLLRNAFWSEGNSFLHRHKWPLEKKKFRFRPSSDDKLMLMIQGFQFTVLPLCKGVILCCRVC